MDNKCGAILRAYLWSRVLGRLLYALMGSEVIIWLGSIAMIAEGCIYGADLSYK